MGDEIEKQNQILHELDNAVDMTTDHIRTNRETLQRHSRKKTNKNCGMYLCCVSLILLMVIVILNLLRSAFHYPVCNKHTNEQSHTQSTQLQ